MLFAFSTLLLLSCGNGQNDADEDSLQNADSIPPNLDSILKADSVVTASYHQSKEDSMKVADSVAKTKNPIRDFN